MKYLKWIALSLVLGALLIVLFRKQLVIFWMERTTGCRITVEKMELSLKGPFVFEGLVWERGETKGRLEKLVVTRAGKLTEPLEMDVVLRLKEVQSREPAHIRLNSGFDLFTRSGNGYLALGKIQAPLGDAAAFFSLRTNNVWLAPFDFSISGDRFTMDRCDFLLGDRVHLCVWGTIDGKSLHLDLGIPAATLASSFNVKGLPSRYVLKIPVNGTIDDPKFDTKGATKRIAAFEIVKQIPLKGALGGVTKTIAQPKIDPSVPEPKYPFPW